MDDLVALQLKNPDHRTLNFENRFTGSKVMGISNLDFLVQSEKGYHVTSFGSLFLIGPDTRESKLEMPITFDPLERFSKFQVL